MSTTKSSFRRFTRFNALQYDLKGLVCGISEARLKDFSIGGAAFIINRPLSTKQKCTLDILADGEVYRLEGQVVWSRNIGDAIDDAGKSSYTVGFRFDPDKYTVSSTMIYKLLN